MGGARAPPVLGRGLLPRRNNPVEVARVVPLVPLPPPLHRDPNNVPNIFRPRPFGAP